MKFIKISIVAISVLLWLPPALQVQAAGRRGPETSSGLRAADEELNRFFEAKEAVFSRDWPQARKRLEKFLKDFPASRLGDEALYWLARSLNGCAGRESSPEAAVALKTEAFETLARLVREHPASNWKNAAEELRIEIAAELVLLGAGKFEAFIREHANSKNADTATLKIAALNSLIRLEPETAFTALASVLEKEGDPLLRRRSAALLGQNYDREALATLEKAARSDGDAGVREEAASWVEQIRMRLIAADLSYYAVAAQVTGAAARGRLKEGILNRFTTPRNTAGVPAARRIISAFFGGQVGEFESWAEARLVANRYILRSAQTSHKLHDFRISIVPGSVRKSAGQVIGEIELTDLISGERRCETFSIDAGNDQIFAARRGDKAAVILLHFEPVAAASAAETEAKDEESLTGILGLLSKIFGGPSPVYYNLYPNFMGCRVHSQSTAAEITNITDFGTAKVEIPAKTGSQGTWTLTGHIVALKKMRTFVARKASLTDPKGRIVAVADEITVAIDNPAGFLVQGSRLPKK